MLRRLASATLLLLFACDDGPACVIDTDCEGFLICIEETCVPQGGQQDAEVADGPTDTDDGGSDDGGPSDMGPAPGSLGTGSVSARSVPAGVEAGSYRVTASFTPAGGTSTCTTSEESGCSVVTCEPPAPPADMGVPEDMGTPTDGGPPAAVANAGTIQLSGGTVAISMEAEATGFYTPVTGMMPLFMQGDALVATAPGDTIPSFRTTGLEGVDELLVTAPTLPETGPLTISSTMAAEITWTPPETPTEDQAVQVALTSVVGDGGSVSITCEVPVADGTFTVTPEILALMPGGATHRVRVITRDAETLDREGWRIDVEAWARGRGATRNFDLPLAFIDDVGP